MKAAALLVLLTLGLCFSASGGCPKNHPGWMVTTRWARLGCGCHPLKPQIDCSAYKKLSDREKPTRCTLEYFPICGSNGQTYTNTCLFCSAVMAGQGKIHFKHYGKC